MKWWHWLILELLIIFGIIAWIYFFPGEFEDDFGKGLIGFVLIYAIEQCKDINRRKTMDYKEGMTCGECLKYEYCPVANHNANHKACMKITTKENYTIEQNAGENQVEGGVVSISGPVEKHYRSFKDCRELIECYQKKYKSAVGCDIYFPSLYKPCIWVKSKEYGVELMITGFDDKAGSAPCVFVENMWKEMNDLFNDFTFLDGSPCGKLEE